MLLVRRLPAVREMLQQQAEGKRGRPAEKKVADKADEDDDVVAASSGSSDSGHDEDQDYEPSKDDPDDTGR